MIFKRFRTPGNPLDAQTINPNDILNDYELYDKRPWIIKDTIGIYKITYNSSITITEYFETLQTGGYNPEWIIQGKSFRATNPTTATKYVFRQRIDGKQTMIAKHIKTEEE